jgi:hypothetical protein
MFKYETHLHTRPVSACARATVFETLSFYKSMDYDGVFITNHFLDGNISVDTSLPYDKQIEFYFSDYEEGIKIGEEIGIKVFLGIESSYKGTDFLIFGLDKQWFLSHPEIMRMKKSEQLLYFRKNGALVIQAHPFREAAYIDHIRLFPRCIDGVEVINAGRTPFENKMAALYAEEYNLLRTAGTDNHLAGNQTRFAGVAFSSPLKDEQDFICRIKKGDGEIFTFELK